MDSLAVVPENATEIRAQADTLVVDAKEISITNDDQYREAAVFLRQRCKAVQKRVEEAFDPIIEAAHRAHAQAIASKKKVLAPIVEAESIVKRAIAVYSAELERKSQEEYERVRAAAVKIAEDEQRERADQLYAEGKMDEAAAVVSEPIDPAVTWSGPIKLDGVTVSQNWKYRVVDPEKINRAYMTPDHTKIGRVVRALKVDAEDVIGGIEVYAEARVGARA